MSIMLKKLLEKDCAIAVIDPSETVRVLLVSILRSLQFENAFGFATYVELQKHRRHMRVDWVIGSALKSEFNHAGKFLDATAKEGSAAPFVTLLLDGSEMADLPQFFANGILSWHRKPINREKLSNDLRQLLQLMRNEKFDGTRVAAQYLRPTLFELKRLDDQLLFNRNMVQRYATDGTQVLELADTFHAMGKTRHALAMLNHARTIDKSLEPRVAALVKQMTTQTGNASLGIKQVVLIEPDGAVVNGVRDALKALKVNNLVVFGDGAEALKYIRSEGEPDLILTEWKTGQLSGPGLLHTIFEAKIRCPVILITSLIQRREFPLLKEMGVANLVMKPIVQRELLMAISWSVRENANPNEQKFLERNIEMALRTGKIDEAETLIKKYDADDNVEPGKKKYVQALRAFHQGDYATCRNLLLEAAKLYGYDSLMTLNLLGKCLMKLNDHAGALKCLQKAHTLSPTNVDRLCGIAESAIDSEHGDSAQEALAHAKRLAPESDQVRTVEAKIAITSGNVQLAREIMEKVDSMEHLISSMNNRAVLLIKSGRFQDGLDEYKKTLAAIPEKQEEARAIVLYNYGLALTRMNKLDQSLEPLAECIRLKKAVSFKAKSLYLRIKGALQTGAPVELRDAEKAGGIEAFEASLMAEMTEESTDQPEEEIPILAIDSEAVSQSIRCLLGFYVPATTSPTDAAGPSATAAATPLAAKKSA